MRLYNITEKWINSFVVFTVHSIGYLLSLCVKLLRVNGRLVQMPSSRQRPYRRHRRRVPARRQSVITRSVCPCYQLCSASSYTRCILALVTNCRYSHVPYLTHTTNHQWEIQLFIKQVRSGWVLCPSLVFYCWKKRIEWWFKVYHDTAGTLYQTWYFAGLKFSRRVFWYQDVILGSFFKVLARSWS